MIVDTGILYALADRADGYHEAAKAIFVSPEYRIVPEPVLVETDYLVLDRLGVDAEIAFLKGIRGRPFIIESPTIQDRERAAELVATYRDLRIGYVDACIVAIAERLGESTLATVDRRHLGAITPRHVPALELVPTAEA